MLVNEDKINKDINNKIQLVKKVLDDVYEILKLFGPLMTRMFELEEAKKYKSDGTFEKAAFLFGEISQHCKEIEGISIPSNSFLENLGN